ncbi:MAG TPA: YbaK/EbsC family protein [Acidimicrobiales bacterium]|nr:YbaK/EbsC family protein [Acidimicrobiales bacterium]
MTTDHPRDDIERRVVAALDAAGVPYELLDCDPALADTAAFSEHYGYPVGMSANTIVVASKREPKVYAACVVLAPRRLDVNNTVKRRMGVNKASFATAEETTELTGMQIGGVTALALPPSMPLWVDGEVMRQEAVILGGGSRAMKVKVAPEVFNRIPGAEIVDRLYLD